MIQKPMTGKATNSRGIESRLKIGTTLVAATPTTIGLWDLETTHTEVSPPEATFYRPNNVQVDESLIGGQDARVLVKKAEFAEGGKYRSVVKLMTRMEGHDSQDPWMIGTGWLIEPDLIVTAGHMGFDWDHKLGFTKEIKAYIGYDGRDHVSDPSVQFRHGVTIATPAEWIKAPRENYDVAFLKINKPFTGVKPFEYSDTPAQGDLNLGVVGYPGDLKSPKDTAFGEHMYEMYMPTKFDLAASKNLLQYEIDTFGGNSGSPVIVHDDMKVIGVHVLGGSINSASVIGPVGNVFELYKESFHTKADPSFDFASKVPSRVKSFRVVTIKSKNERLSKEHKEGARTESQIDTAQSLSGSVRSLLDSSHHENGSHEDFVSKLENLLEPSMVKAMKDACGDAKGLEAALRFLWNSSKDAPSNTESLLSKATKNKRTVEKVGKQVAKHQHTAEEIAGDIPAIKVLKIAGDTAAQIALANNDEDAMEAIVTGLHVTVPMAGKGLPKLGPIGGPVAAIAASTLLSVGSQAAATLESDANELSESLPVNTVQGAPERATLAEAALHGIMRLDESVLDQNQVHEKLQAIMKPLTPIIKRADPMLAKVMQPTIVKLALNSLKPPKKDAPDSVPKLISDPKPTVNGDIDPTPTAPGIVNATTETPTEAAQDETAVSAFTEALIDANPDYAHKLPEIVKRAIELGDGAFTKATLFGLPIVLGSGPKSESAESEQESMPEEAVTGLAQRAMLAEAALQVVTQLPVDVVKTLDIPNVGPMVDALSNGHDEADQQYVTPVAIVAAGGMTAGTAWRNQNEQTAAKLKDQEQKGTDQVQKNKELTQKDTELEIKKQELEHKKAQDAEEAKQKKSDANQDAKDKNRPLPHPAIEKEQAEERQRLGMPGPGEPGHPTHPAEHEHPAGGTVEHPAHEPAPEHPAHQPEHEEHPAAGPSAEGKGKGKAEPEEPKGEEPKSHLPLPSHPATTKPATTHPASKTSTKEDSSKASSTGASTGMPKPATDKNQPKGPSKLQKRTPKGGKGGKREGMLVEDDDESIVAADFVSGFASN